MASFSEVLSVPNATYIRFPKESPLPSHFATVGFDREQVAAAIAEHHDRNEWVGAIRDNNLQDGLILCSDLYSWKSYSHSFWFNCESDSTR